ncbi:MAG: prolipoprotein diacylglyceryl transferase [Clostridia bacterium]|nr:prolipoprotein diacylglyceryl transferase [Clostridia bacterium]
MLSNLLAESPLFGTYDKGIYLFGFAIQYYAIVILCGMLLAAALSALLMKRRNIDPNFVLTLFVFCIPTAIIGARLFSCLTDPSLGIAALFKFPWEGLSITGGIIGGVIAGFIVCLVSKVNFFRAADCVVITVLLAQAIGRWGNYFNAEVYGGVVENPAWQWFPFAVDINGTWHYAFFFYESVVNLIGFAILYSLAWFYKSKPNGIFMFAYFVWYGTVRSIMEPFRDPSFILDGGGIWWSEVFAVLMIVFGVGGIATLLYLNHRKEGALFGSKTGDPCGITKYLSAEKDAAPYYSKINMLGENYPPKPVKKVEEKSSNKKSDNTMSEEERQ